MLSLAQWERLFGQGFCGLFVFAYNILGDRAPLPYEQLFIFRDRAYAFVAVRLADYAGHARPISAKWDTLAMPAADFRRLARPLDELLGCHAYENKRKRNVQEGRFMKMGKTQCEECS